MFGNRTDELPESYRRYLLNALRRDLKLGAGAAAADFRGRSNPFDQRRERAKANFTLLRLVQAAVGPRPSRSGA